jgi:predicted ABC-type sugar transport system permease subunit
MTQQANPPDLSLPTLKAAVILERYALLAFLVVILGFAALASPVFLHPANLLNVPTIAAPLGMVVLGQTVARLVRGLDLSVASLMASCGAGDSLSRQLQRHDSLDLRSRNPVLSARRAR